MTKRELSKAIAEATGVGILQAAEIVQRTFDAIVGTLLTERRIELRGFAVFEVTRRAARSARNPRTGERILVPEKLAVAFRPSKELTARIQPVPLSVATGASDAA